MGLAVLPARLKGELTALSEILLSGAEIADDSELAKHKHWVEKMRKEYTFTADSIEKILRDEVGAIFARVLEHAGVYKCDAEGREAFRRFIACV